MITKLIAKNLNGRSFEYPLAPLQIFTGNNARGKSTILDALQLVTTGAANGAASNAAIMDGYGTGPSLLVAIETTKGKLSREWKRKGKSVSEDCDGDETIGEALGLAMINGEAFFRAKPAVRANMLRAAFPNLGDPKEAVRAAFTEAKLEFLHMPPEEDLAFDAWVDQWLAELTEAAKGHRANVKRMTGVIQGLAQLDADALASTVTKEQLDAARVTLGEKTRLVGAAEQAVKIVVIPDEPARPNRTVEALHAAIAHLTAERDAKQNQLTAGREGWQKARDAYEAHKAALSARAEAEDAYSRAIQAGKEGEVYVTGHRDIIEQTEGLSAKIKEAEEKARLASQLTGQLKQKAAAAQAELNALESAAASGCECPSCGAAREFWKEEIRQAAEKRLVEARAKCSEAAEKAVNADEAFLAALKVQTELVEQCAKRDLALAIRDAGAAMDATPIPDSLTPVDPGVFDTESLESSIYELGIEITEAREELADWDTIARVTVATTDRQAAEDILTNAQDEQRQASARVEELARKYDAALAARETEAKQTAAREELDKAKKELDDCEAAADVLKAAASKESEKVLKPLVDLVNQFTAGIMSPPISAVGLDLGRWHGAQWQPLARLSGAEKAMVICALSAALASEGSKLVVLDEFSVIDDNWKPLFLARIEEARQLGMIEQAVILDNRHVTATGWETTALA